MRSPAASAICSERQGMHNPSSTTSQDRQAQPDNFLQVSPPLKFFSKTNSLQWNWAIMVEVLMREKFPHSTLQVTMLYNGYLVDVLLCSFCGANMLQSDASRIKGETQLWHQHPVTTNLDQNHSATKRNGPPLSLRQFPDLTHCPTAAVYLWKNYRRCDNRPHTISFSWSFILFILLITSLNMLWVSY